MYTSTIGTMRFYITSIIAVPLESLPYPFPPLPIELVRNILELAARQNPRTGHSLLLVSKETRRWIHPIVYKTIEIFGLRRMLDFAALFAGQSLLASSVQNLSLYDDTPGDILPPSIQMDKNLFSNILTLCRGVRRLAFNYIRGIPRVDGLKLYELTIRRGIRGVTLKTPPFEEVTHLHCRFEQLTRSFLTKLATTRLTHFCFTHHLDFPDVSCRDAVERLLRASQLQMLIVEVAFQRWHTFVDPSVRRLLAENMDKRLFVRLSKYDTVRPYDEQRVFSDQEDVWDVSNDTKWRTQEWEEESISRVYSLVQDRSLPSTAPNG